MGLKTESEAKPTAPAPRKTLSHGEEVALDRQIGDLQKQVDGQEIEQGLNHQAPNRANVQKRIGELKRIRETRSVRQAVGSERDQIEMQLRKLTAELQVGMPTWAEYAYTRKKNGPIYDQIKQWIIRSESDPVRRNKIAQWKYLRRRLDPTDPYIASTKRLFPKVSQLADY